MLPQSSVQPTHQPIYTKLVDTHCHLNMMVKETFGTALTPKEVQHVAPILGAAQTHGVSCIINVGTDLPESLNSIELARTFDHVYAAIGIHPNDCTTSWRDDLARLTRALEKEKKSSSQKKVIVGIGECGLDRHYPDYDAQRQKDAFRAQIELALTHNLALIVHTRDARDETLRVLEEYRHDFVNHKHPGIIHCFSEDLDFANTVIGYGFALGIGGTLTYPKNDALRSVVRSLALEAVVLETDAPFLPPQPLRGQQNSPATINVIAHYLAELKEQPFGVIAHTTTTTALNIFRLENSVVYKA